MTSRLVNFLMSFCHFKKNVFTLASLLMLLFFSCTYNSIAHAGPLLEKIPSINLTTEEKTWLLEHPEITIAHSFGWPPYSFLDGNSQPVGPSVEFFEIVAKIAGFKFKVHQDGLWNRIYEAGKNKQVDVVASMTITKKREQWFSFPRPYLFLSSYIITRKDFQGIKHRDDLKGKKLSAAKGTWQHDDVLEHYPSVSMSFVDTYRDALLEVSAGKVDATVVTLGSALYEISQRGIYNLQLAAVYEKDTDLVSYGVRKDWPELVSIIDKALAAIPEATKIQIINKWMPPLETLEASGVPLTKEEQAWIAEKHPVRVRVPIYPPYFIMEEGSTPGGIAIDYLNLISERTGLKFNYYSSDKTFAEALDGLKKHQGPDLFAVLKSTPERQREILFSKEYLKSPYVIFTHTDETHIITGIDDMLSKKFAMIQGTALHEEVKKDYPNINLLPCGSEFEAIEAVATKKADAYIGDLTVASYYILEEGLYNVKIAAPSPFGDQLFSIGSRSDWPELASIIEKGLASITSDEKQKIRNKYFSIHYARGVSWVDILKWGGAASGIVFFSMSVFIFWNRKLKVEISERKQAEIALLVSKEKAETSESQLRAITDNLPILISQIDKDLTYIFANKFYYDVGLFKDKIIGQKVLDTIGEKTFNRAYPQMQKALSGEFVSFQDEYKSKKNKLINFETNYIPHVVNGQVESFFVLGIDITDRKQAEEEKKKLENRLQQAQKMESIGTLAGGIAHDFNNILAAILGYAEMAKDECQPESTIYNDLNEVLEAGNRAKSLVRQILAFSRQDDAERVILQPARIVKETITMLRPSLPTTIEIIQNIDAATGLVFADPSQLNQILMNLCTNAFHAMEETGGKLEISLKEVTLSNEDLVHEPNVTSGIFIQLSIADSGTGVAPAIRGKIFDPYFTTKETGKGTGMGLAMVHGIVKGYGGFISFYSELGEGSIFHVFLPVMEKEALTESEINDQIPIGQERILFVDDEEILAKMGKTMLERLGYHVTVRNSSLEALETFQNQPDKFDIVITDQTMPGMTGSDLSRRMLQVRFDIPIILCTGYSTIISEEKAKAMGIKEFAFKPLAKKDIAKLIRKVLDAS